MDAHFSAVGTEVLDDLVFDEADLVEVETALDDLASDDAVGAAWSRRRRDSGQRAVRWRVAGIDG